MCSILVVWQDSEYTSAFGISQSLRYDTYKKEVACLFIAFVENLFWFQFRITTYYFFQNINNFCRMFLTN